jgi:hypothetical protein
MEKIFNQKNFHYFVGAPLGRSVNIYINFCLQVHFKYLQPDIVPIIFTTSVNATGGKFAAGVVDTGGKLPPANLPPVLLTPVAIRIDPNVIFRVLGKVIHEKNLKQKIS